MSAVIISNICLKASSTVGLSVFETLTVLSDFNLMVKIYLFLLYKK